jgi:uncharacterized membrane protein YqjE
MNETASKVTAAYCRTAPHNHERSLTELISQIRDEVKSFLSTRVEMMRAEFQETVGALKVALPLAVVSLGLLAIAGLLFTAAVVALVASAFAGSPHAWFFAFAIVGVLWAIFAAIAGYFAYSQLRGGFPKRTVEVLKADKLWFQSEARMRV